MFVAVSNARIVRGEKTILSNVNLDVVRGELVALVGPSGCGKTSLLRIIAGLDQPNTGSAKVDGILAEEALRAGTISFAFQDTALLPWLSCLKNAGWLQLMRSGIFPKDQVDELVQCVGLDSDTLAAKRPGQVSGGERQRVALIRALSVDAPLLVLDEPFSAVDFKQRKSIIGNLRERLRKNCTTCILVTHDLRDAIHFADRLIAFSMKSSQFELDHRVRLPQDRTDKCRESDSFNSEAIWVHRWIQD